MPWFSQHQTSICTEIVNNHNIDCKFYAKQSSATRRNKYTGHHRPSSTMHAPSLATKGNARVPSTLSNGHYSFIRHLSIFDASSSGRRSLYVKRQQLGAIRPATPPRCTIPNRIRAAVAEPSTENKNDSSWSRGSHWQVGQLSVCAMCPLLLYFHSHSI